MSTPATDGHRPVRRALVSVYDKTGLPALATALHEAGVSIVSTDDWSTPLHVIPLFGGQGTVNVASWSPDSRHLAVVAYPLAP